jgi:predicted negative regulator of RcsB-dependent stress response
MLPTRDHSAAVEVLKTELPYITYIWVVARQLDQLYSTVKQNPCNGVDADTVKDLARIVLSNPRFQSVGRYIDSHHQLMAKIAFDGNDLDTALAELELARKAGATLDIHIKIVLVLLASESPDAARQYLDEVAESLPRHPAKRIAAKALVEELRQYVDSAAASK